jgi:hypothetical protein
MDATESKKRIDTLRGAFPAGGLFAAKDWLVTPTPFRISRKIYKELESLGHKLFLYQQAANRIYLASAKEKLPGWIADYLDAGKSQELINCGREPAFRENIARVIRPDVILTEDGFAITELDNLPGGIGLTAWLNETYAALGDDVIGGADGMVKGFNSVLKDGGDIVISEESADYRPEMDWLAPKLEGDWQVHAAENYQVTNRDIYRFFELFDLDNVPCAKPIIDAAKRGEIDFTAPCKPFQEEKMWSALFWLPALRSVWEKELRGSHLELLEKVIPESWIMDPTPLPHHASLPRLGIHSWEAMKNFSQRERELVLKISGFSEIAWGSKSVNIGDDMSQPDWAAAIDRALGDFSHHPWLLQRFRKGKIVEQPYWDANANEFKVMEGRVRLCPYYFIAAADKKPSPKLGGILATIVPSDKKIIHGMKDGILAPCVVE